MEELLHPENAPDMRKTWWISGRIWWHRLNKSINEGP